MAEVLTGNILRMRQNGSMYPLYVDLPHVRVYTLFFPSETIGAPVLIYHPGGPGASGIGTALSTFTDGDTDLTSQYHLIVMDVPGDTGFSIKKSDFIISDEQTVNDMMRVLRAMFKVYEPLIGTTPLIDLFGFSYAGKILPLLGQRLYQDGYSVRGLAIFSGYTDPLIQEVRPIMEYLLYGGLITSSEYEEKEKITNLIEEMIREDPYSTDAQILYLDTLTDIWDRASANTYNIETPIALFSDDQEGTIEMYFNDVLVQKAFGVSTPYTTSLDLETYRGFLSPANDALLFLADKGVLIIYVMGSLDGAVIAKGTRDMIEDTFKTSLTEDRWIVDERVIGRISRVRPNVIVGTIIGADHSLSTDTGMSGFRDAMDMLSRQT